MLLTEKIESVLEVVQGGGGPGISGTARFTAIGLTGTYFFGIIIRGFGFVCWADFRDGITIGKLSLLSSSSSDSSSELKQSLSTSS